MKNPDTETWSWCELMGFDNTKSDFGVEEYLNRVRHELTGISFYLGSVDFVLLHEDSETDLFPDICSRHAHLYNEERMRQVWTNHQLCRLVELLQKNKVKVFFSVNLDYFFDEYHQEWFSRHGRHRYALIGRLPDGTSFVDVFLNRLIEVIRFYNFDGWHISDGVIPDGNITDEGIATYHNIVQQFAETSGKIPPEMLAVHVDAEPTKLSLRREYIWKNHKHEWRAFIITKWQAALRKIVDALHADGRKVMMNSVCAKSEFETLFFCGFDMRHLGEIKVDYLVTETVATSMALMTGDNSRLNDFAATAMELKALLPNVKFLSLTPCKDVVESFNSIRHAPSQLERDFHILANLFYQNQRCFDGFMICLGDSLTPNEWDFLHKLKRQSFCFDANKCEGFTFAVDSSCFDKLCGDYDKNGTLSPYLQVSELLQQNVEIFNAIRIEDIDEDTPLFVPGFDLLQDKFKAYLSKRRGITVITGNFNGMEYANGVFCRINSTYLLGCVFLHCKTIGKYEYSSTNAAFDTFAKFSIYDDRCPVQKISRRFWETSGRLMRGLVNGGMHSANPELFTQSVNCPDMEQRIAICSKSDHYLVSDCHFHHPNRARSCHRISDFPVHPLTIAEDGKVICQKSLNSYDYYAALRIPPKGIVVVDVFPQYSKKCGKTSSESDEGHE